jgi:hypothetical protein
MQYLLRCGAQRGILLPNHDRVWESIGGYRFRSSSANTGAVEVPVFKNAPRRNIWNLK